jgi:hypothetical protein
LEFNQRDLVHSLGCLEWLDTAQWHRYYRTAAGDDYLCADLFRAGWYQSCYRSCFGHGVAAGSDRHADGFTG